MTALEDLTQAFNAAAGRDQAALFHRLSGEKQLWGDPATVRRLYALWDRLDWEAKKTFITENF